MRKVLAITCAIVLTAGTTLADGTVASQAQHPKPAHRSVLRQIRRRFLGARALAGAAVSSSYGEGVNRPYEWGQGGAGFAKRLGSAYGMHVVKAGIETGMAYWLHENLHYQRSNLHGITWTRVKYVIRRTFIVPRTRKPGTTPAFARVFGGFGAGLISRLCQPASTAGIGAGFASGGIALAADIGFNAAREFWPQRNHGKKAVAATATAHR